MISCGCAGKDEVKDTPVKLPIYLKSREQNPI